MFYIALLSVLALQVPQAERSVRKESPVPLRYIMIANLPDIEELLTAKPGDPSAKHDLASLTTLRDIIAKLTESDAIIKPSLEIKQDKMGKRQIASINLRASEHEIVVKLPTKRKVKVTVTAALGESAVLKGYDESGDYAVAKINLALGWDCTRYSLAPPTFLFLSDQGLPKANAYLFDAKNHRFFWYRFSNRTYYYYSRAERRYYRRAGLEPEWMQIKGEAPDAVPRPFGP